MFTQRKLPDYARPGTRRRQLHCLACPVGAGLVEVYGDRPGRTAEWGLVGSRDELRQVGLDGSMTDTSLSRECS
jgi:hypothetical protein